MASRSESVPGGIGSEIAFRNRHRFPRFDKSREMHDHFEGAAPEDAIKRRSVLDVSHNQFDRRGNRCAMSVTEIVEHGHPMSAFTR